MADRQKTGRGAKQALRLLIFLSGLVILAAGLTLNTKTTLGVSPMISVAYSASEILGVSFANATFCWYGILILIQIVLHLIKRPPELKKKLAADVLQFAVSLISTRFMELFGNVIPVFETAYPDSFAGSLPGRLLLLALAILLTGVGASMSLFTRIVPNPADGFVQGVSDFTGIPTGSTKNLVDLVCVILTVTMSLIFAGKVIGIGIGTLAALVGVGRVVAVFESLFGDKIKKLTE